MVLLDSGCQSNFITDGSCKNIKTKLSFSQVLSDCTVWAEIFKTLLIQENKFGMVWEIAVAFLEKFKKPIAQKTFLENLDRSREFNITLTLKSKSYLNIHQDCAIWAESKKGFSVS